MFLKHYGQVLFINFCAEAAQPPTLVRVSEHHSVSPRTGEPVKGTLSTSVRDHMLVCNHKVVHKDFKFLGNESNRYLLELKKSLFIKRDKPSLNKNLYSQELLASLSKCVFQRGGGEKTRFAS